tara:strand:- start:1143 stop:2012 length:870 start_codon:yes stop_codon:yes gene_type:complete
MKIIIPQIPTQIFYNLAQCLESIKNTSNIELVFWSYQHKSIVDMFDELQPDIVFLHESQLDAAFNIVSQEFDFRYVLLTENAIPNQLVKQPDAVLTHPAFRDRIENNNIINLRPLASVAQIHNAEYQEDMSSDILVNTSGIELTPNIYNIISFISSYFNSKIIGEGRINSPRYLGEVNIFERANFIKSTQLVVDINQYDFWDASYLQIPAICLHPTDSHMISFANIPTLKSTIDSLLRNHLVRNKYIETCYNHTIQYNTYYHLAAEIFRVSNEQSISQDLLAHIERLTK